VAGVFDGVVTLMSYLGDFETHVRETLKHMSGRLWNTCQRDLKHMSARLWNTVIQLLCW